MRRAIAIAVTPPTTPPAIAPRSKERLGLGDALDEAEGLGSAMLLEGDKDEVALEAALETEDGAIATVQQETNQFHFSLELETLS